MTTSGTSLGLEGRVSPIIEAVRPMEDLKIRLLMGGVVNGMEATTSSNRLVHIKPQLAW